MCFALVPLRTDATRRDTHMPSHCTAQYSLILYEYEMNMTCIIASDRELSCEQLCILLLFVACSGCDRAPAAPRVVCRSYWRSDPAASITSCTSSTSSRRPRRPRAQRRATRAFRSWATCSRRALPKTASSTRAHCASRTRRPATRASTCASPSRIACRPRTWSPEPSVCASSSVRLASPPARPSPRPIPCLDSALPLCSGSHHSLSVARTRALLFGLHVHVALRPRSHLRPTSTALLVLRLEPRARAACCVFVPLRAADRSARV